MPPLASPSRHSASARGRVIATPAAVSAVSTRPAGPYILARAGQGLWRLLTSVDFAVAQIIVLALLAVVGMTIRQMPDFAFRSATDYASALEDLHARYDPVLGSGVVDVLEAGVVLILPYRVVGTNPNGTPISESFTALALANGETGVARDLGLTIQLRGVGQYTLLIAKRDPGQGLVWLAFALLITGIAITFCLPRRRVWTRLAPDGRLGIVWRSDRYIDVEREFGRLLDQLVAARRPA